MENLTPQQIVADLDKYIVGQPEAKRAVAIALRNRYRRLLLDPSLQSEVMPKNILMIGPTGVGKTEIARRVSKLADAPFVKVEATKFTEVGYVGRDVESIVRDLVENSISMVHQQQMDEVREQADQIAEEKIIDYLLEQRSGSQKLSAVANAGGDMGSTVVEEVQAETQTVARRQKATSSRRVSKRARMHVAEMLHKNMLDEETIEIEVEPDGESYSSVFEFMSGMSPEEMSESFQDFVDNVNSIQRKRSRRVSVREARKIIAQEEAQKLVDFDAVIESAVKRAEQNGVVFIDEIDKITGSNLDGSSDVSGEGVQRDLLPIVEGSTVGTRYGNVKTDHVLFIAAGSFHASHPSDLIPELQGRFPLRVELAPLSEDDLRVILTEPENALTKQYTALLGTEGVGLEFSEDGVSELAHMAAIMNARSEDIGARRLHTIMEKTLEDVSFDAPEMNGQKVVIDREYVEKKLEGLMEDEDLSKFIL
jgi:ATP-dependent HslUV protease ATP-binding subunit HslU